MRAPGWEGLLGSCHDNRQATRIGTVVHSRGCNLGGEGRKQRSFGLSGNLRRGRCTAARGWTKPMGQKGQSRDTSRLPRHILLISGPWIFPTRPGQLSSDSGPRWGRSRWHLVWPLSPVEQDWPRALHRELRLLGWHCPHSGQSPAPRLAPPRATPRSSSLATACFCSEPLPMGNGGQGAVFSRYPPHQADCPPALIPAVKTAREKRRPAFSWGWASQPPP